VVVRFVVVAVALGPISPRSDLALALEMYIDVYSRE
jgi:hypothetical protein